MTLTVYRVDLGRLSNLKRNFDLLTCRYQPVQRLRVLGVNESNENQVDDDWSISAKMSMLSGFLTSADRAPLIDPFIQSITKHHYRTSTQCIFLQSIHLDQA